MLYLPEEVIEVLDVDEGVVLHRDVNELVVQCVQVASAVVGMVHPWDVS